MLTFRARPLLVTLGALLFLANICGAQTLRLRDVVKREDAPTTKPQQILRITDVLAPPAATPAPEPPPPPDRLHELVSQGDWAAVANYLNGMFDEGRIKELNRDQLMEAAEAYLHAHDAATAREVLGIARNLADSPASRAVIDYWLLESMLMLDDESIAIPVAPGEEQPLYPAIQLRRGLLMELRGDVNAAREVYNEIKWSRNKLPPPEQAVLDSRMNSSRP